MTDEETLRMVVGAGLVAFSVCIALGAASAVKAALAPDSNPAATELAFVVGVQKDLLKRFPTVADALEAGYFRYTNEDTSGSISYANLRWQSADPQHPSQLWYDLHGTLLGADFSVLASPSKTPPSLWGVPSRRWFFRIAHIYYILAGQNEREMYGLVSSKKFAAAGGDMAKPDGATLVKLGVVSTAGEVKRIFTLPTLWDLSVWVKPNPNGAFADLNPLVTPSADAGKSSTA
jgi:hypothetical protein